MSCVYLAVDSLRLCNQIIQFSRRWEMLIIASGRCGLDTRVAVFQQGYPPAPPPRPLWVCQRNRNLVQDSCLCYFWKRDAEDTFQISNGWRWIETQMHTTCIRLACCLRCI